MGLTVLVGRWGRQGRGPLLLSRDCLGCVLGLCFVVLRKKMGSPSFLGTLMAVPDKNCGSTYKLHSCEH
jgi:hypothetical protein